MGNAMIFSPLTSRVFDIISCHGYRALSVLGKDIPLKYVFKHIFLSIVLFNLIIIFSFPLVGLTFFCDIYDLSSNILLLM